jgi:hypothetical protein
MSNRFNPDDWYEDRQGYLRHVGMPLGTDFEDYIPCIIGDTDIFFHRGSGIRFILLDKKRDYLVVPNADYTGYLRHLGLTRKNFFNEGTHRVGVFFDKYGPKFKKMYDNLWVNFHLGDREHLWL